MFKEVFSFCIWEKQKICEASQSDGNELVSIPAVNLEKVK